MNFEKKIQKFINFEKIIRLIISLTLFKAKKNILRLLKLEMIDFRYLN